MDLNLTEQQQIMVETARDWLRDRWHPAVPGPWIDGDELLPRALWDEATSLGWSGLAIAESHGGLGGGLLDLMLLQEELGRALFPATYASTAAYARLLDRQANLSGRRRNQLEGIANRSATGTLAVVEANGRFVGNDFVTRIDHQGGSLILNGEKWFVRDAEIAGGLAVLAIDHSAGAPRLSWALVDRGSAGLDAVPLRSTGRDRQHRVRFATVRIEPGDLLPTGAWSGELPDQARTELMLLECAYLLGVMAEAHDRTIGYARERVLFGQPIGSVQAIQHKVADMTTDLESGRLLTHYAASLAESGGGQSESAFAKIWVSEAAQRVLREAHQIHGGIGYIVEHPLHRYFRRAKTGELMHGAPHELVAMLGVLLLDTAAGALP